MPCSGSSALHGVNPNQKEMLDETDSRTVHKNEEGD